MKKLTSLLLTFAVLLTTLCVTVPLETSAAGAVDYTVDVKGVNVKYDGTGVFVYTNSGSSDKKFNSITYHFGSAKLFVFAKDGHMTEAGENLVEARWCVQENLVVPAGGFAIAFPYSNTTLTTCWNTVTEGAMLYNFTMPVIWKVTGTYDAGAKKVRIQYDNSPRQEPKEALRFLFVGNSTTYVHACPIIFKGLCEAAGQPVIVDYCTKGSAFLSNYADEKHDCGIKFRNLINKNKYDYVVLQDAVGTTIDKAIDACEILMPYIKKNGAKPVFYMRYSDSECNPTRVNNHYNVYSELARYYDTVYAPIVVSFYRCFKKYPSITLMADDGGHHSKEGAYLIACTWMYAFLGIDPLGNKYTADMDATTVKRLQEMAKSSIDDPFVRLDSPDTVPVKYEKTDYDLISTYKKYTCSAPFYGGTASGTHVDKDSKGNPLYRLTNGIRATEPAEGNSTGQIGAYSQAKNCTLTLDLETVSDIKAVTYDLWGGGWGIPVPEKASITVAVSEDGKKYSAETKMSYKQTYSKENGWRGGLFTAEFATLQKGRYVRLTISLDGNFLWSSELAVYGKMGEKPIEPKPEFKVGDINGNGGVDAMDYMVIRSYYLKTSTKVPADYVERMDLDGKPGVSPMDIMLLRGIILGTYKPEAK